MKRGLPDLIWEIPVEMTLSQQINLQAAQRLTVQVALGRQLKPVRRRRMPFTVL